MMLLLLIQQRKQKKNVGVHINNTLWYRMYVKNYKTVLVFIIGTLMYEKSMRPSTVDEGKTN